MYDNQGQDEELAEFWGEWQKYSFVRPHYPKYYYLSFLIRHNEQLYHPRIPNIVKVNAIASNQFVIYYLLWPYQRFEFVFYSEGGISVRTLRLPCARFEAQKYDKYYHSKKDLTEFQRIRLWDYILTHNKTPPRHFCDEKE